MMRERCVVMLSLVVWITVALLALIVNPPLGHDESQYAVAARATTSPWLYLPPGTVAIAQVGTLFGNAAWVLRLVPIVLGVGFLLSVWWLGRVVFGAHVGAFAAAIIAGAHPLALHSAELLGDLPAATCVLLGIGIVVRTLDGDRRWHLVAAAPAFAAAFYIRYGAAPIIAIIAMTTLCLWWRAIVARPWPVIATACVFVALLVPHVIHSLYATGSVLGIMRVSAGVPYHGGYVGEGLVTYLTSDPLVFYGVLATPVMIAGLASMVRPPRRWRPTALFVIVAIGQIVSLGLETRAQPRYVAIAIVLLVIAGVDVVTRALRSRPHALRIVKLAQVLVVLAWVGTLIAVVPRNVMIADARAPLELAAATIRADAAGRPCVVAGSNLPQLMWLTSCTGVIATAHTQWPAGRVRYHVALPLVWQVP